MRPDFTGTRFEGDGRKKLLWLHGAPGGRKAELTRSQARVLITKALDTGRSMHSGAGGTMWPIVEYAQYKALRFTVCQHWVGSQMIGWSVELLDFKS